MYLHNLDVDAVVGGHIEGQTYYTTGGWIHN